MRSVDLGLKTALIVTPVSVLHKRTEFTKWRPCELKPLHIFMHDDFPREKRVELLTKWKDNGGVLLIGYAAFRNLFLGKYVKDRDVDNEISCLLQNKERTGTNWKDISVLLAGFFGLYDSCRGVLRVVARAGDGLGWTSPARVRRANHQNWVGPKFHRAGSQGPSPTEIGSGQVRNCQL
ncbi:protein chromatin remodeling 20 [Phtheirospermum japonicum]|uniref:Protein chromatin remodeling 20 n=1 Tax=Phtheirospermum japonicum TaxID=374723 RepID=A0A830CWJ9_9LAMI|nr:protein chromatin remodeling 20 [Phtheirospermum japonicum]